MTKLHLPTTREEIILLVVIAILCSACDFYLRGPTGLKISSLYLQSELADRVTSEVKRLLAEAGIPLAASAKEAHVVVYLRHEILERRVLSVSAISGKLEEIELNYRVEMEARRPEGIVVLKKQLLSLLRDYSFETTAVLAMGAEEEVLREELFQDLVAQVIRRLTTLREKVAPDALLRDNDLKKLS